MHIQVLVPVSYADCPTVNRHVKFKLRNYDVATGGTSDITLIDAILATVADPKLLPPVQISKKLSLELVSHNQSCQ